MSNLSGIPLASWICMYILFPRFREVFAIVFLNTLSASFFLSLCFFWTPIMYILFHWQCSINLIGFLHSFSFIFFSSDWIISNDFSLSSQILFSAWQDLLLKLFFFLFFFHYIHCFLQLQNIYLILLYDFNLFVKLLILFLSCFPDFIVYLCSLVAYWAFLKQQFWIVRKFMDLHFLGFVTGNSLCSFGGVMLPWLFLFPVALKE